MSVAEIDTHRAQMVNPKLQTRTGSGQGRDQQRSAPPIEPSINVDRGRNERVKAEMVELDLARRLGLTLSRQDVEQALAEAAALQKQTASLLVKDRAEALARITDDREMEIALDKLMQDFLAEAADALNAAAMAGGEDESDAA